MNGQQIILAADTLPYLSDAEISGLCLPLRSNQAKAQYGDLPEMHARRATTDAVYDRSKRPARRSVD